MAGDVTGGRLKTPADADSESLQAKWISDLAELSLRANDVVPLVERGRQFALRRPNDPWYEIQVIFVYIVKHSSVCSYIQNSENCILISFEYLIFVL